MKLLTKSSDYAIRALAALSGGRYKFLTAREIAAQEKIPYQFLRRILQTLIKHKLVTSREGLNGGFRINMKPADISVADIIRIFQGDVRLTECMFRKKICPNRPDCILRREIMRIARITEKEFEKITFAKLLKARK